MPSLPSLNDIEKLPDLAIHDNFTVEYKCNTINEDSLVRLSLMTFLFDLPEVSFEDDGSIIEDDLFVVQIYRAIDDVEHKAIYNNRTIERITLNKFYQEGVLKSRKHFNNCRLIKIQYYPFMSDGSEQAAYFCAHYKFQSSSKEL